jgi:hypothetical protein
MTDREKITQVVKTRLLKDIPDTEEPDIQRIEQALYDAKGRANMLISERLRNMPQANREAIVSNRMAFERFATDIYYTSAKEILAIEHIAPNITDYEFETVQLGPQYAFSNQPTQQTAQQNLLPPDNPLTKNIRRNVEPVHITHQMVSANRDYWTDQQPNEFSYRLREGEKLENVLKLELVSIHVPSAKRFTQYPNYCNFYVRIIDAPTKYVIQNDRELEQNDSLRQAQFQCYARIRHDTQYPKIYINNGLIRFDASRTFSQTIRIQLLDDNKRLLEMPNDVYAIQTATMNAVTLRTDLVIGNHSIAGGSKVQLRGITIQGNAKFYDDINDFSAIVINATTISINAYQAGATFILQNATVLDRKNQVSLALRFYSYPDEKTAFSIT